MHARAFHAAASSLGPTRAILATLIVLALLWPSAALGQSLAWTQRAVSGPSPRSNYAMAYDSARGVTVLFGGNCFPASFANAETWEWDGTTWTRKLVSGPSGRYGHAMAYDSARGVTVLFGGSTVSGPNSSETWEWDGTTWTQRLVNGPAPRRYHAMVCDAARGVVVLFGGQFGTADYENASDTWEWNGAVWTQRQVSGPPSIREHAMAYDPQRGVTVLYGGYVYMRFPSFDETWEWNGTTWTQRLVNGPTQRIRHAMYFDASRERIVVRGGSGNNPITSSDYWEWDGTAWTQQQIEGPSARYSHAMVYDTARGVAVLFGGRTGSTSPFENNGETWELRDPNASTCPADLDNDGDFANGLTRDGAVTVEDLLAFLVGFEAGNVLVDLDNGTYTGTPDNAVDINDLLFFLVRFEAGC